jgi:hypothetical protein
MNIDALKLYGRVHHSISGGCLWIDNCEVNDAAIAEQFRWRRQPIWTEWGVPQDGEKSFTMNDLLRSFTDGQEFFILCGVCTNDRCVLRIGECDYAKFYEPGWHEVGPIVIHHGSWIYGEGQLLQFIGWRLRVFP